MFYKLAVYLYQRGRRQAYAEIVSELETLAVKLPRTRDGQILREPIDVTIKNLKAKLADEEG